MSKKNKNTLVPKLRFPEFVNDGNWVEDTLINIAGFRRGSFPQPYGLPEWYDDINGMPFIQVYDVGEDFKLKPKTKNKISKLGAEQSVFIPKGTVIITIQGSIGRVAITQYDAYIDRTLLLFEEFYIELDKTFFAYLLFLLFEIEKLKAPGGIIKTITKEVLSQFVVELPSPKEQQKIAACLSSLDEVITAENQKLEVLKEHKKGLLQNLFPQEGETVPKLRFKEFENSGEWEVKKLGEISDVSKLAGYEFTKHIKYEDKGEIIALRGLNIKNNSLDLTDVKYIDNSDLNMLGRSKLYIDDLMFTYIGTIGEVALIEENNRFYLAPNVSRIRANKKFVNPKFLLQYFNIPQFKDIEISKYISSSSQPALTMGNVRMFSILFPNLEEQKKIASALSSVDDLIIAQGQKLEALQLHKKGLLQGLFPQLSEP